MATCKNCDREFDINDINEAGWMEADDEGDICGECVREAEPTTDDYMPKDD